MSSKYHWTQELTNPQDRFRLYQHRWIDHHMQHQYVQRYNFTVFVATASDNVETDWISVYITTDDKGDISTESSLFNAMRE